MALDLLAVLAEPNRRRLLGLLAGGERSVSDLASEFDVTRSAISQHLTVLVEAGLVSARQQGRFRYYRIVPEGIAALHAEIDRFWTAELDLLARSGRPDQGTEPMSYDKSVFIPVSPDEAFALVTEPDRLRRWLTVAARVDLRAGGDYRFTVTPGHVVSGTVREVEPGKRVVLGWGWDGSDDLPPDASTVTITIAPSDGGSFVRLVHDGLNEEQAARHAEGWNHFLDRLVVQATDGDAGPDEWAWAPDPIDSLNAAEATLALCLRSLRDLTPEELTAATPCEGLDVSGLVEHLLGGVVALAGAAGGTPVEATGTVEERVAAAADAALAAWHAKGIEGSMPFGPAGELPCEVVASILAVEFLVHGWDFATAVGRPFSVDDSLATWVQEHVAILTSHGRGDAFGPAVDPADDATPLERLLAFTGRNVPAAASA